MIPQKTATNFDFRTVCRGIEQLDAEMLIPLYADHAEMWSINRDAPPGSPQVLRGKDEIAEHLTDVCGQNIKARLQREIVGDDGMAYLLALEYPDGCRLVCATLLDVCDGKIVKEVGVQAWDE